VARRRWPDLAALAGFAALAFLVTAKLWLHGGSAATADNTLDHAQFLFFFQHAAYSFVHLHNPLFTTVLGAPAGVNLMANTAFLGMAVPLIPITLLFGPGVSYVLALTIALFATATAWYVVLRRHVTTNRAAAFLGAAFCGFAPGLVGHGNGHPNLSAQFLLPLIVSGLIRMRETAHPVRSGVVLGLLTAWQVFLNEELLLFTAAAAGLMVIVYVCSRPRQARAQAGRFAGGVGVALGVAVVLVAYPLWFQFRGPQHYHGPFLWAPQYWTDVANYPAFGGNSLAGWLGSASALNNDPAETNAFFGLPLCILAVVTAVVLWRMLAVRVAAVVAAVFLLLSLGSEVTFRSKDTHIAGPWRLVAKLPLFDAVITPRMALVVVPAVGVLIAAAADRLLAASREGTAGNRLPRALSWGLLAAVLVPLVPTPLHTSQPDPVPEFITAGTWRQYVSGGNLVTVPPDAFNEATLHWLVATNMQLPIADGYFLGPTNPEDATARYGPADRTTGLLLYYVAQSGFVPDVDDDMREVARADMRYWNADVLVMAPQVNAIPLAETVNALLGRTGRERGGLWVWDVHDLR